MSSQNTLKISPASSLKGGRVVEVEVDLHTTSVSELRYQLFSLTDIPPERIYLHFKTTVIHPNDMEDASHTLAAAGITPTTLLQYSNSPPQQQRRAKHTITVEDVRRGLQQRKRTKRQITVEDVGEAIQRVMALGAAKSIRDPDTEAFLARVRSSRNSLLKYEDEALKEKALKLIPLNDLKQKAQQSLEKKEYPTLDHALFKQVLHWFKHSFFTWFEVPDCWSCGKKTKLLKVAKASASNAPKVSRTEIFGCSTCGGQSQFPRYHDASKLLETRKGRCGEWAQAFTLIVHALGFRVRAVHCWTDHVWTEVFLPNNENGRWMHADCCEDIMDEPLLYERGWGKKLNYCIATGFDVVIDVTKKYTEDFSKVKERRTHANENLLREGLMRLNQEAVSKQDQSLRAAAEARYTKELHDLESGSGNSGNDLPGRQSGSSAWVESRGEDGTRK